MSSDQSVLVDREPEKDPVGQLLRLVAPKSTRRLKSEQVRSELRALVQARWQDSAACATADPEAWFPTKIPVRQVAKICASCPVNRSCLAVAMLWDEEGIWGGTTRRQRRQGYQLLRRGVSAAAVVELLLTPTKRQRAGRCRWSGKPSTVSPSDAQQLPLGGGPGGQEAA